MSKRYLLPFMMVAIAASIGSCSSNSTSTSSQIPSETPTPATTTQPAPTPSQTPSMAQLRAKPTQVEPLDTPATPEATSKAATTKTAAASKTVNVTLFTSDTECQELIPQKVAVPAEEPVTGAVGKIIDERDTADFSLSGYRVKVQNGVATVDLRLSPQSKRQLASLSSCEQFALFGSLRKTLTSNPQWNIKEVRFTEKGEEIVL